MHAHRINLIALAGSLVVALAALAADASIEERARVGGGWNRLYLVAPALHVFQGPRIFCHGPFHVVEQRRLRDASPKRALHLL